MENEKMVVVKCLKCGKKIEVSETIAAQYPDVPTWKAECQTCWENSY